MAKLKLNKQDQEIIKEINKLFNDIEGLFCDLSKETQDAIFNFHNEHYSLNHCIRWGIQASDELTR